MSCTARGSLFPSLRCMRRSFRASHFLASRVPSFCRQAPSVPSHWPCRCRTSVRLHVCTSLLHGATVLRLSCSLYQILISHVLHCRHQARLLALVPLALPFLFCPLHQKLDSALPRAEEHWEMKDDDDARCSFDLDSTSLSVFGFPLQDLFCLATTRHAQSALFPSSTPSRWVPSSTHVFGVFTSAGGHLFTRIGASCTLQHSVFFRHRLKC